MAGVRDGALKFWKPFGENSSADKYMSASTSMVEEKARGGKIEISAAPAPQHARVIDIMEALKKSMEKTPARGEQAAPRRKRRSRG
jgi:non-homologous end joining protein Ku